MSNESDLMDLLFAGTRQRVLAVLLLRPDESFHLRELARMSGSHAGTLLRDVEKLAAAGLLMRRQQGNQVRYQANRSCSILDDLASVFRKTHGVAAQLRAVLTPLKARIRYAALFGSEARGTARSASDIDVLIVGDVSYAELVGILNPLEQSLGRDINPVLFAPHEFLTRAKQGQNFVSELARSPLVHLMGDKDVLEEPAVDRSIGAAHR